MVFLGSNMGHARPWVKNLPVLLAGGGFLPRPPPLSRFLDLLLLCNLYVEQRLQRLGMQTDKFGTSTVL